MVTVECPKCKGSLQVDEKHDKIFCMYCRAEVMVKKPKSKGSSRAESLIKKGFLALEHREWGKARKALNKAAEIEPENAQIYVGLLMVETGCAKEEDLGIVENNRKNILINGNLHAITIHSLSELVNYQKAERFADDALKQRLNTYNEQVIAIEAEVKRRKGWKSWIGVVLHSLVYPIVIVEILSFWIEGHLSILNLSIFGSQDTELMLIVYGMFALIWLISFFVVWGFKLAKIRDQVKDEFRNK